MCDSLVALGSETRDGVTLFAKNSDRRDGECQPFLQFPAMSHPTGARVRATHVEIPQVAETYRVMGHSPWWVWGFEHGVNEHALAIGNQTVFSKEPIEEEPGLIGMDLVRLALERAAGAREALEVISALLARHGQGGPAQAPGGHGYHNGFLIADPHEAWILETSNRRWAARRVTRDACSNQLDLGTNWDSASPDLEQFARAEGWWDSQAKLDVAAAYRNPHVPLGVSAVRLARSRALLAAGDLDAAALRAALRDHGDPPAGLPARLPKGPHDDGAFATLCAHTEPNHWTTASLVAPLPADHTHPWPVWVGFGAPCTGVFLPVYLHGLIPGVLAQGGASPDEESAWWVFQRLQDAAERDWPVRRALLRRDWRDFESWLDAERQKVEGAAGAANDRYESRELLDDFMTRSVTRALDCARTFAAKWSD